MGSDTNDDWTLRDGRIAELLVLIDETPCPTSAYCPDPVSSVQFALHIVAKKALVELQEFRAAKRADAERAKAVVREAILLYGVVQHMGVFIQDDKMLDGIDAIATRVAEQLASSAPVLSVKDRDVALRMRKGLQYDGEFTDLLDRLLGAAK